MLEDIKSKINNNAKEISKEINNSASAVTEMAKSKGNRVQVILECTEHKNSGLAGTSRYITTKNRRKIKKQ